MVRSAKHPLRWLSADGVLSVFHGFEGALDGVFHDGHATTHGILDELDLLEDEDVHFSTGSLGLFFGLTQDLLTALSGFGQDHVLGHHHLGTIPGRLDNAGCFVLRLADDALTVLDDALGLLDLVREGNAKLVDEGEEVGFLDHDAVAERHTLADTHQLLELIHKVEDVCGAIGWVLHSTTVAHR
jgi:hypothetical protein